MVVSQQLCLGVEDESRFASEKEQESSKDWRKHPWDFSCSFKKRLRLDVVAHTF